MRGELFRDEDYAELHRSDKGMDSVPPSLLATALVRRSLLPMRYNSPWAGPARTAYCSLHFLGH